MDTRIHIKYNEQYNFNEVTCDDGYVMTDWDGKDILEYTSTKIMYCPLDKDLESFYTITDEQDGEYKKEQERRRND